MTEQENEIQARLKDLEHSRLDLDQRYIAYKNFATIVKNKELNTLFATVLQSAVFQVDLRELSLLFNDKNDPEGKSFSSKCNLRFTTLRMLERVERLSPLYENTVRCAERLGVISDGSIYEKYCATVRKERNSLLRLSAVRNTAGHYDQDVVKFLDDIDSVDREKVLDYAVMAVNLVREFNEYVFSTLNKCLAKTIAEENAKIEGYDKEIAEYERLYPHLITKQRDELQIRLKNKSNQ